MIDERDSQEEEERVQLPESRILVLRRAATARTLALGRKKLVRDVGRAFPELLRWDVTSGGIVTLLSWYGSPSAILSAGEKDLSDAWTDAEADGRLPFDLEELKNLASASTGDSRHGPSVKDSAFWIMALEERIQGLEEMIGRLVHSAFSQEFSVMMTVPGVRESDAVLFLAEIGDLGLFASWESLCAWAGVGTYGRDYRRMRRRRVDPSFRSTVLSLTKSVVAADPSFAAFYGRKRDQENQSSRRAGGGDAYALNACANRVLRMLWAMLHALTGYDASRVADALSESPSRPAGEVKEDSQDLWEREDEEPEPLGNPEPEE